MCQGAATGQARLSARVAGASPKAHRAPSACLCSKAAGSEHHRQRGSPCPPTLSRLPRTCHVQSRHLDVRLLKGGEEVLDIGGASPAVHQLHTGRVQGQRSNVSDWLAVGQPARSARVEVGWTRCRKELLTKQRRQAEWGTNLELCIERSEGLVPARALQVPHRARAAVVEGVVCGEQRHLALHQLEVVCRGRGGAPCLGYVWALGGTRALNCMFAAGWGHAFRCMPTCRVAEPAEQPALLLPHPSPGRRMGWRSSCRHQQSPGCGRRTEQPGPARGGSWRGKALPSTEQGRCTGVLHSSVSSKPLPWTVTAAVHTPALPTARQRVPPHIWHTCRVNPMFRKVHATPLKVRMRMGRRSVLSARVAQSARPTFKLSHNETGPPVATTKSASRGPGQMLFVGQRPGNVGCTCSPGNIRRPAGCTRGWHYQTCLGTGGHRFVEGQAAVDLCAPARDELVHKEEAGGEGEGRRGWMEGEGSISRGCHEEPQQCLEPHSRMSGRGAMQACTRSRCP